MSESICEADRNYSKLKVDDTFFFFRSRINLTLRIKNILPFEIYWFSFTVNLMTLKSVLQNTGCIGKN